MDICNLFTSSTHGCLAGIGAIDPFHKSYTTVDKYPTVHHFVSEISTRMHISVTKWCIVGDGTRVSCDLCNMPIIY